jgi:23S rRNA (uracil1939-C5)-methyltransferase
MHELNFTNLTNTLISQTANRQHLTTQKKPKKPKLNYLCTSKLVKNMARKKPQFVQNVSITGIADAGMSVGRSQEGEVIFVQGAVPGDLVDVVVYKKRKKIKIASVKSFVKYSEDRVQPFCQHFDECGGCKWQNLNYEAQVRHKHVIVSDAMKRIGKITDVDIETVLGAKDIRYYRNKLEYAFAPYRWLTKEEI